MRKKVTNDDVEQVIRRMANEIRNDIYCEINDAEFEMTEVEKKLVKTFNEEQLKLYREFCQKRKEFYDVAQRYYKFDVTDN